MKTVLVNLMAILKINPKAMDDMHIPDGLDRDLVIDTIVLETAGLSIVYSDPLMFPIILERWSRRRNYIWTEMYKTLLYKYDPISNYDRWEETVSRNDHEGSSQTKGQFETSGNTQDKHSGDFTTGMTEGGDEDSTGSGTRGLKTSGSDDIDASYETTRTPELTRTEISSTDKNGETSTQQSSDLSEDTTNSSQTTHSNYGFNSSIPAKAWDETLISKGNRSNTSSGNSSGDSSEHTEYSSTIKDTGTEKESGTSNSKEKTSGTEDETTGSTGHRDWTGKRDETGNDSFVDTGTHDERGADGRRDADQSIDFNASKSHMYGNIGVTTTQQMIEQQRKVVQLDIIDMILKEFKQQFCIGIY